MCAQNRCDFLFVMSKQAFFYPLSQNLWVWVPAVCVGWVHIQNNILIVYCNPVEHVENNDIILWSITYQNTPSATQSVKRISHISSWWLQLFLNVFAHLNFELSLKAIKWAVLHVRTSLWQFGVSLLLGAKACAEWSHKMNFGQSLANYLLLFHSLAAGTISLCLRDVQSTYGGPGCP